MEHLSIGPTPAEESCEQLGPNYQEEKAKTECNRFIEGLRKYFGNEPVGAKLHIHRNSHDFGTYLEVCVQFNENNKEAINYAYLIEGNTPKDWDTLEKTTFKPSYNSNLGDSSPGYSHAAGYYD